MREKRRGQPYEPSEFGQPRLYASVRHRLYLGFLLAGEAYWKYRGRVPMLIPWFR